MCINKKRFYNKWSHSWQWQDCGKCPACQQAKANRRTQRIKNAVYDGYITLFVTLTYRNINIPYIRKDEIKENSATINVYRDCTVRRVRVGSGYDIAYKYERKRTIVKKIDCLENKLFPNITNVKKLPKLRGQSDHNKVSVILFKDVQDFEKRLRTNLLRHYGVNKSIYTFKCSEYGPTTQRSHFHLLVSCPQESLVQLQSAIVESWPYDSRVSSAKSIQIARNAASYVSSYVNRGADFPTFLDNKCFRPKHSFSRYYGTTSAAFALPEICGAIRRGDLSYNPNDYGTTSVKQSVMYPQYACNRYFRKFYGYSRLTYDEIVELVANPRKYFETSDLLSRFYLKTDLNCLTRNHSVTFTGNYDYDFDRMESVIRQINNQCSRFLRDFEYVENNTVYHGLPNNEYNRRLYADYLYRFWTVYYSTLLRKQYESVTSPSDIPWLFENMDEVYSMGIRSDILNFVDSNLIAQHKNPNLFVRNVNDTLKLMSKYKNTYKRRKVTNRVMVDNKFNV